MNSRLNSMLYSLLLSLFINANSIAAEEVATKANDSTASSKDKESEKTISGGIQIQKMEAEIFVENKLAKSSSK